MQRTCGPVSPSISHRAVLSAIPDQETDGRIEHGARQ